MKKLNESYLEIKKSKFIGLLYEVNSLEEIDIIINELKKEYKKARHIVYAYKIDSLEKNYADNILDLVAIGAVADMMDLRDFELKELIELGINNLRNPFISTFVEK